MPSPKSATDIFRAVSGESPFRIEDADLPDEELENPYATAFSDELETLGEADGQTWIILGDIHSEIDKLALIPGISNADGVIITGDLTKLGSVASAREVIEAVQALNPVVLAQIGNMDRPEVNDWLEAEGINLHCKVRELSPDVALIGVGGSTFTLFGTPSEFPESRFAEWLENLAKRTKGYKSLIVVSHNPPYDTACDRLANGVHVGSQALREFLEEHQPAVCLCGHIHEAYGQQLLGRTMVVNPGAFAAGGYIVMQVGESVSINLYKMGSVTN